MSENPPTSLLEKWRLLQAIMADPNLSPTAKNAAFRLLYHMNTKDGRCTPSYETLARGIGLKRRRTIDAVQELEAIGWIHVARTTHDESRRAGRALPSNSFSFAWEKVKEPNQDAETDLTLVQDSTLTSAGSDTSPSAGSDTSLVQSPTLASAGSCTPLVQDPAPKYGKDNKGREQGNKSKSRASKRDPETAPDFAAWWPAFPKKVDKKRAAELYRKIVDGGDATPDELMLGAQRYAQQRAGEDPQFTKHPKTWLNGRCWLDEPTGASSGAYRPKGTSRLTAAEAMLLAGGFGDDR